MQNYRKTIENNCYKMRSFGRIVQFDQKRGKKQGRDFVYRTQKRRKPISMNLKNRFSSF